MASRSCRRSCGMRSRWEEPEASTVGSGVAADAIGSPLLDASNRRLMGHEIENSWDAQHRLLETPKRREKRNSPGGIRTPDLNDYESFALPLSYGASEKTSIQTGVYVRTNQDEATG